MAEEESDRGKRSSGVVSRRRFEKRVIFIWSLTEGLDTGAGGQEVEELDNPRDCGLLSSVIGMKEENCRKILVYSIGS